ARNAAASLKSAAASGPAACIKPITNPIARSRTFRTTERVYCGVMLLRFTAAMLLMQAPDSGLTYFERGMAHASRAEREAAIGQFEMALRLRPDFADAWYNLGALQHATGDVESAIRSLEQAVALGPDHADAWNALGIVLEQQGQAGKAVDS